MGSRSWMQSDEANDAGWAAAKGAVLGAVKWGAAAAILATIAHIRYPVYRGTTIQFKVFLQSSAMVAGGIIEADSRLRQHELQMRMQKRVMREKAKWERYEQELMKENEK